MDSHASRAQLGIIVLKVLPTLRSAQKALRAWRDHRFTKRVHADLPAQRAAPRVSPAKLAITAHWGRTRALNAHKVHSAREAPVIQTARPAPMSQKNALLALGTRESTCLEIRRTSYVSCARRVLLVNVRIGRRAIFAKPAMCVWLVVLPQRQRM